MAVVSWSPNSYFDFFSVNKKVDGVVTFINIFYLVIPCRNHWNWEGPTIYKMGMLQQFEGHDMVKFACITMINILNHFH